MKGGDLEKHLSQLKEYSHQNQMTRDPHLLAQQSEQFKRQMDDSDNNASSRPQSITVYESNHERNNSRS